MQNSYALSKVFWSTCRSFLELQSIHGLNAPTPTFSFGPVRHLGLVAGNALSVLVMLKPPFGIGIASSDLSSLTSLSVLKWPTRCLPSTEDLGQVPNLQRLEIGTYDVNHEDPQRILTLFQTIGGQLIDVRINLFRLSGSVELVDQILSSFVNVRTLAIRPALGGSNARPQLPHLRRLVLNFDHIQVTLGSGSTSSRGFSTCCTGQNRRPRPRRGRLSRSSPTLSKPAKPARGRL